MGGKLKDSNGEGYEGMRIGRGRKREVKEGVGETKREGKTHHTREPL